MKIAHIVTRLLRAGSEENTLLTAAGQLAQGHEVILVHGPDAMPEHARRLASGVRPMLAPDLVREVNPWRDAAAFRDLRRMLIALKPDVVHTHQSKAGIVGRFAAASAHVPLIVHGVHILPFIGVNALNRSMYLWSERAAAQVTHAFIHVSSGMQQVCLENGVGVRRAHFVVPSGFSLRRFAEAEPPEDWRKILNLAEQDDQPIIVAMLAAFEPRKSHLTLLDNIHPLLKQNPHVRLLLAGEGHLRPEIEARVTKLDLGRQVILTGFRQDPERIIALADICIHCSEREGLPRSVLQYLAGGRPVVIHHLPGIEDVMSDGENGWVVPQGNWAQFVNRLESLVSDPVARAALAKGARSTPLERWDASHMAERTMEIYRKLLRGEPQGLAA